MLRAQDRILRFNAITDCDGVRNPVHCYTLLFIQLSWPTELDTPQSTPRLGQTDIVATSVVYSRRCRANVITEDNPMTIRDLSRWLCNPEISCIFRARQSESGSSAIPAPHVSSGWLYRCKALKYGSGHIPLHTRLRLDDFSRCAPRDKKVYVPPLVPATRIGSRRVLQPRGSQPIKRLVVRLWSRIASALM